MGKEENVVQNKLMKYINLKGVQADFPMIKESVAFRINSKGIKGRKSTLPHGFPDILSILTIKGKAIPFFIEVKAPSKKCTNKEQLDFIKDMESRGAWAQWSNSLEMTKEYIRSQLLNIFAKGAKKDDQSTDTISLARQNLIASYTEN